MAIVKLKEGGLSSVPPIKLAQLLGVDQDTQHKLLKMQVKVSVETNLIGGKNTIVLSAMDASGGMAHVDTGLTEDKLLWATADGYAVGKGGVQLAFVEAINKLYHLLYPKMSYDPPPLTATSPEQLAAHVTWAGPDFDKIFSSAKKTLKPMPMPTALSIKEATEMMNTPTLKKVTPVKMPAGFHINTSQTDRVHLRDATDMYQPVFGTDGESMYHVIALGQGLNAAGRIRQNFGVSIRMEGPVAKDETFRQKAMQAGFTPSSEGHISLHVNADSEQHAVMALGSMLAAVPFNFDHSAPALKAILYKGV